MTPRFLAALEMTGRKALGVATLQGKRLAGQPCEGGRSASQRFTRTAWQEGRSKETARHDSRFRESARAFAAK